MVRVKKQKRKVCDCQNCGYRVTISPDTVKEKTFEHVIATYVECPVCGERVLKQLDTEETRQKALKGAKMELLQKQGRKLTDKQKSSLKSINKMLSNKRSQLKKLYWDETYYILNQD